MRDRLRLDRVASHEVGADFSDALGAEDGLSVDCLEGLGQEVVHHVVGECAA
jgi:hypothetical protein